MTQLKTFKNYFNFLSFFSSKYPEKFTVKTPENHKPRKQSPNFKSANWQYLTYRTKPTPKTWKGRLGSRPRVQSLNFSRFQRGEIGTLLPRKTKKITPKTMAADGGGVTAKQNFRKRKRINWVFAAPSSPPSSSSLFLLSLSLCFLRNQLRVNVCFRIYKKNPLQFIYLFFIFILDSTVAHSTVAI